MTITGTSFVTGAKVTFGKVAATSIEVVSPTSIIAITPKNEPGAVDVGISAGGQLFTLPRGFTYEKAEEPPAPPKKPPVTSTTKPGEQKSGNPLELPEQ